ncbi:MAG: rod shape-determining protein MreD [Elusimicrobia bacterium]|nr:rod shape-determining protein MreD [Elusimicrobiota bacterium]
MKRRILFFVLTAILGWSFQLVFLYWAPPALPTPHWLLLVVLALGARGRVHLAMGLGFLWGLALDAHGITAFGVQGWLLALAGYASGTLSKNLNANELVTQESLAVGGTLLLWAGVWGLSRFFQPALVGHPGVGLALGQVVLNALTAPAVFWATEVWIGHSVPRSETPHA